MRIHFDEQLQSLNKQMIEMGSRITNSINLTIKAFETKDSELAKKIMEEDIEVDQLQKKIENSCFELLIRQQPVAKDLRAITAAMKMVTDMERIGDHAADISEITISMNKLNHDKKINHINKMALETTIMLNRSIEAYVEKDEKKAREVIAYDDVIDNLFIQIKNDVLNLVLEDSSVGEEALDIMMIAKYFERIGDHSTNIAEWVLYSLCIDL